MTIKKKVPMHVEQAVQSTVAPDEAVEGARRATGNASSGARPDPEVVAVAQRRQFGSSEKQRILALADACKQPGEVGALLRREGIYSSHLSTWRKQRTSAEQAALEPQKRGRKIDPALAEARLIEMLTRENEHLRRQLTQAELIIDVQKKSGILAGCVDGATARRRILMEAVNVLAPDVGLARACDVMNIPRGSVYRTDARQRHLLAPAPVPAIRPAPPLALSQTEREAAQLLHVSSLG
jgi:hypothetical protein